MALLDTTALIDLGRRANSDLHRRVRRSVAAIVQRGQALFTSRINEAEFRVGPERSDEPERELERVERILRGLVILEFDARAAMQYARIKAHLLDGGRPAGDCDTLIAAIAMVNGQSLLTRNPRHFADIADLEVEGY